MAKTGFYKAPPTWVMAIDQNGQAEHGLDSKHPRKALLRRLGATKAHKMYVDLKDGGSRHTGYIVGSRWFTFYTVTKWEGGKNVQGQPSASL